MLTIYRQALISKIAIPKFEEGYDLQITLEYVPDDSVDYNEHEAVVVYPNGAKIYAINNLGKKGEEVGIV